MCLIKVIFSKNRANYDTSMPFSGDVQLMFLIKFARLAISESKMATIFFKMAAILHLQIGVDA